MTTLRYIFAFVYVLGVSSCVTINIVYPDSDKAIHKADDANQIRLLDSTVYIPLPPTQPFCAPIPYEGGETYLAPLNNSPNPDVIIMLHSSMRGKMQLIKK